MQKKVIHVFEMTILVECIWTYMTHEAKFNMKPNLEGQIYTIKVYGSK
jgi:hypothetical protein